jgi:hypothetical protein
LNRGDVDVPECGRKRRCIMPVDDFFEWKAIKGQRANQPYAIAMKNGAPFGLGGTRAGGFVQLNYSIDDRAAERTLLPLAADRGAALLVNLPFGGGGLLRRLSNRPLPDWAGEISARVGHKSS